MTTKTTNLQLIKTIRTLRKTSNDTGAKIWDAIADKLEKPKHRRVSVNISRINRHSIGGETIIIPGKVLGTGKLEHELSIAAFTFSKIAKKKIEKAGGTCLTLQKLIQQNPKGSNIKIIG
ncbi:MAG: 50S ribosomal protein L18e [Candidatus Bathyarchaeota archaeon]|nr:MAG: 50S ribosomal protein L18e [Candidatus Bathyarchaeota archaeon]